MPTLREFFATEAAEFLQQLSTAVQRLDAGAGDAAELQRHTRSLRGTAQLAKEERVYRSAISLEAAARSLAAGALAWSADVSERIRSTLEDLAALARGEDSPGDADARVRGVVERWREIGVTVPDAAPGAQPAEQITEASKLFRQFAAHEVSGIVAEMEMSIETLAAEPRNREPLKAILRRSRALLGAARLQEISVVSDALHGVEDITRVIAKLNIAVKDEWLHVFRAAHDVLKTSLGPLQRGDIPGPTPALSKLRVMRQELLDRYGQGEPLSATGAPQPTGTYMPPPQPTRRTQPTQRTQAPAPVPAPARAVAPVAAPTSTAGPEKEEVVSIESLVYSKEKALERVLELQPSLAQLATSNPAARESVEELFDLIRLGFS